LNEEDIVMKVVINGREKEIFPDSASVADLLGLEGVQSHDTVAVQYNGEFLGKEAYDATNLKDGDDVEFVYFLGGGWEVL
jgi:sulfur carrier protein